jgi:hypothetical protein
MRNTMGSLLEQLLIDEKLEVIARAQKQAW